jgi:hypothetical protein
MFLCQKLWFSWCSWKNKLFCLKIYSFYNFCSFFCTKKSSLFLFWLDFLVKNLNFFVKNVLIHWFMLQYLLFYFWSSQVMKKGCVSVCLSLQCVNERNESSYWVQFPYAISS